MAIRNPASLLERSAFLHALMGIGSNMPMVHRTYIDEKLTFAMDPYATQSELLAALDDDGRSRMLQYINDNLFEEGDQ